MYSVNQVNQLYVVTKQNNAASGKKVATIASADPAGTIGVCESVDGWYRYFKYKNVLGDILATDRIKKGKVKWVSFTNATEMRKKLRVWTITMNSAVNGGNPVPGQDYILNFSFRNYFGMSDEDKYEKHASARAFTTNPSDLLATLVVSLAKNFSREIDMPFKIEATVDGTATEITPLTKADSLTSVTNIILTEKEQPWQLGRMKQTRPQFDLHFVPVVIDGLENYMWGNVAETESNSYIGNGKETADMEWFFKGERGDQYRGKDWPLSISTPATLLADPTKEYNYMIVHFWDDIDNEGPQKSERDMTFVADSAGTVNLDTLAKAVAKFAGLDHYIKNGVATTTAS